MCKCTPNIRTPFCGKPGCEEPARVPPPPAEGAATPGALEDLDYPIYKLRELEREAKESHASKSAILGAAHVAVEAGMIADMLDKIKKCAPSPASPGALEALDKIEAALNAGEARSIKVQKATYSDAFSALFRLRYMAWPRPSGTPSSGAGAVRDNAVCSHDVHIGDDCLACDNEEAADKKRAEAEGSAPTHGANHAECGLTKGNPMGWCQSCYPATPAEAGAQAIPQDAEEERHG